MGDPFRCIRDSFRLIFADDPDIVGLLDECTDAKGLIALARPIAERGINHHAHTADQTNALDVNPGGRMSPETRIKLSEFLGQFTNRHFFVQSTSANLSMAEKANLTPEHVDKPDLLGDVSHLYRSINVLVACWKGKKRKKTEGKEGGRKSDHEDGSVGVLSTW